MYGLSVAHRALVREGREDVSRWCNHRRGRTQVIVPVQNLIVDREFKMLDLSRFSFERIAKNAPLIEKYVV